MSQPLDEFPTDGFCLGAPNASSAQAILSRQRLNDADRAAITAPEPGDYVLDHRPNSIELWRTDGDEPEFTDGALL